MSTSTHPGPSDPAPLPPPASLPPPPPPPRAPATARGRAGVRAVWYVVGSVMALAMLGWGTFNVVGLLAHSERTEVERFDAAGVRTLVVDNGAGGITVEAADGDSITVTAEISEGLRAPRRTVRAVDDRLVIEAGCPVFAAEWCSVDYRIALPTDVALVLDADNGSIRASGGFDDVEAATDNGAVRITGATGRLQLDSDNGAIEVSAATSRDVTATTDNGSIDIALTVPPDTLTVATDNGSIEIVVPADTAYAVTTTTDNGSIETGVATDPTSPHAIDARSDNGDITVRSAP